MRRVLGSTARVFVQPVADLYRRHIYERPDSSYRARVLKESTRAEFGQWAQRFCQNGLLILPGYFKGEILMRMQEDFEGWAGGHAPDSQGVLLLNEAQGARLRDSEAFSQAAADPELTRLARYYWGKPVFLAQAAGTRLEPRQTADYGAFQWHHDAKRKQVKVMILLTDTPADGQRMDYLPGTHRVWHPIRSGEAGYADSRFSNEAVRSWGEAVRCAGPAGTAVLFDTNGLHRGNRNTGPRRDVWVFQYTAGSYLFPLSGLHPAVVEKLSPRERAMTRAEIPQ